jgi:nitrogen fixation protein FixH
MEPNRSLWPYGIVAAFILFILGTIALIVLASSTTSDLVSENYYEQEIRYQGQIDRLTRTAQLDGQVQVAYDAAVRRIKISLPTEHATGKTAGRIQLYRPSAAGLDRELKLELDAAGTQAVDASSLLPGLWRVRVEWTAQDEEYFTDQKVVIGTKTSANASPSPIGWERAGVRANLNPLN